MNQCMWSVKCAYSEVQLSLSSFRLITAAQGRWGSGQRSGAPSCPCCSTDGEAAGLRLLQRSHWASGPVPCPGAILHGLNWSPKQRAPITNLTFSICFLSRQTYTCPNKSRHDLSVHTESWKALLWLEMLTLKRVKCWNIITISLFFTME